MRDNAAAARLTAVAQNVEDAETAYHAGGVNASLCETDGSLFCPLDCAKDMVKLYTNVLSKKGSKLRYIYDEIRAAPKGDICPLCGQRLVTTLDHYLEKTKYPIFAVAPINLVPACTDCNRARSTRPPSTLSEQTFHPYFDDGDDEIWLKAKVLPTTPVAIIFGVGRPKSWPPLKHARMHSHFDILGLGALYSTHAAVELAGIRLALLELDRRGGGQALQDYLAEQATSRGAPLRNSWQGAMYAALSESTWFCSGGYRQIPHA